MAETSCGGVRAGETSLAGGRSESWCTMGGENALSLSEWLSDELLLRIERKDQSIRISSRPQPTSAQYLSGQSLFTDISITVIPQTTKFGTD